MTVRLEVRGTIDPEVVYGTIQIPDTAAVAGRVLTYCRPELTVVGIEGAAQVVVQHDDRREDSPDVRAPIFERELARLGNVPGFVSTAEARAHAKRIKRCTSCKARVIWFTTRNDKWMPVDADTVRPRDLVLSLPRHVSHFGTCPNAKQHRKPRQRRLDE